MISKQIRTKVIQIFIAGPYLEAVKICRSFCYKVGLCVTVDETEYVYSGGQESGVVIGLRRYPRFPDTDIEQHANDLAIELMEELDQTSVMVQGPFETTWFSRREEDV